VSEIATISTVCLLLLFRIAPPLPKTVLLGNVQAPPPPLSHWRRIDKNGRMGAKSINELYMFSARLHLRDGRTDKKTSLSVGGVHPVGTGNKTRCFLEI